MEKITSDKIAALLEKDSSAPAVTIYMPMHKSASPPHMTEDQIRFKNLIHKAVEQLKQSDGRYRQDLATSLCGQLDTAMNDMTFWGDQAEGLLICAEPGSLQMFQLPIDTEEYLSVDVKYHLAPVLGLLNDAQEFHVLTVTQHDPRLFKGDMYGLYPADVQLPVSVQAALNLDEVNQKSEHHRLAGGSGLNTSGFHGRGGARDPGEEDRARFWRMIDGAVGRHVDRHLPLILAGIDAETAEYRHISKYPKLLERTIHGSFTTAKPEDLFGSAYDIIQQEIVTPAHEHAIEEYSRVRGSNPDRAARDKTSIARAADQGRVGILLLNMSRRTTDTVRDTLQAVNRITFPEGGLSAAVNDLAIKVTKMSGKVVGLESRQMPDGTAMAALLRY